VLYSDEDLVVSIKPSGYLAHYNARDRRSRNALDALKRALDCDLYAVHRLDRGTSGLMLFARNREAAAELGRQFRERLVGKTYLALVRGHILEAHRIDKPLSQVKGGERVPSLTHVEPLCHTTLREPVGRYREAWYTLVRLRLETGRLHQARRHLRSIDHPVIGDMRHGDREQSRFFARRFGIAELMLRAYELRFAHPTSGAAVMASSGVPESWRAVAKAIQMDLPAGLVWEPSVAVGESKTLH
jgi:tRNA pseudouridine65 synthase